MVGAGRGGVSPPELAIADSMDGERKKVTRQADNLRVIFYTVMVMVGAEIVGSVVIAEVVLE